jgi:hypothetical protein
MFLSVFIACAISVVLFAEEIYNSQVAQEGCAHKEECTPPKPKEECNKCPERKPSCDKCPERKPRCHKCPPKKPKCQPKEEPKECAPPKPKCDN